MGEAIPDALTIEWVIIMKMNINNLYLMLCRTYPDDNYTISINKGYNKEGGYVYSKHILKQDREDIFSCYSSREFMIYLSNKCKRG